jgi:hypothetical protein
MKYQVTFCCSLKDESLKIIGKIISVWPDSIRKYIGILGDPVGKDCLEVFLEIEEEDFKTVNMKLNDASGSKVSRLFQEVPKFIYVLGEGDDGDG